MARGGRKRGFVLAIGLAFCRDQAILTNMPLLNLRTRPSAANDNYLQVAIPERLAGLLVALIGRMGLTACPGLRRASW